MDMDGMAASMAFAQGALFASRRHGLEGSDAESVAAEAVKEAASGGGWGDDEEDTFWDRNKFWIVPALAGTLAFYAGADGERNGRRDRGYLHNAGSNIVRRLNKLFGVSDDPLMDAATKTPGLADGGSGTWQ